MFNARRFPFFLCALQEGIDVAGKGFAVKMQYLSSGRDRDRYKFTSPEITRAVTQSGLLRGNLLSDWVLQHLGSGGLCGSDSSPLVWEVALFGVKPLSKGPQDWHTDEAKLKQCVSLLVPLQVGNLAAACVSKTSIRGSGLTLSLVSLNWLLFEKDTEKGCGHTLIAAGQGRASRSDPQERAGLGEHGHVVLTAGAKRWDLVLFDVGLAHAVGPNTTKSWRFMLQVAWRAQTRVSS